MTQIILRRLSNSKATRPYYQIAIDLIYIVKRGKEWECWNEDRYGFHAVDEFSKWHQLETFSDKTKPTMMRWFRAFIHRIQRVFRFNVIVVHTDGERGFGNNLNNLCYNLGITVEISPPGTHKQNGLIERGNQYVITQARALRLHARLLKTLDNEMFLTAAYIINRTPTESLKWKTLFEIVYGRQPLVAHMKPIGCKTYCFNCKVMQADKTKSRALIGYLVGYRGTNIFKIYLFSGNQNDPIIFTRDAIFDHTQFFTGLDGFANGEDIEEEIKLLAYSTPPQQEDVEQELLLTRQQAQCQLFDTPDVANNTQVGGETNDELRGAQQISGQNTSLSTPSDNLHPLEKLSECEEFATPRPAALLNRQDCSKSPPPGYQKKSTKATKDINLNVRAR